MKRRPDPSVPAAAADLAVFDGRPYRDFAAWKIASDLFHSARAAYADEHGGLESLPEYKCIGKAPFDPLRFIPSSQKLPHR